MAVPGHIFLSLWSSLGVREVERKREKKGGGYRVLLAGMTRFLKLFKTGPRWSLWEGIVARAPDFGR